VTQTTLPTRALGKTGLEVTTLGVGCAWLGRRADGSIDQDTGLQAILAALDSGVRLIDTASLYAEGTAERVVGEALRARPELADIVVETKVRDVRDFGYTSDETRRSVELSLERLGVSHIPMVFIHDPAAGVFDRVMGKHGALEGLRKLQAEGVVGHVGIASNNPWDNAPYIESGEFEACVVPDAYSLLSQVALERMFPAAQRHGMGVVVATPLERGILATGTRALRPEDHINRAFTPEVLAQVDKLEALCVQHGISLLAAALQFVVRHPAVHTTIPGVRRPEQSVDNTKAMLEPIPDTFWTELEPLLRTYSMAVAPA
jgi:D-threo-aldose 1-dehydrogenase